MTWDVTKALEERKMSLSEAQEEFWDELQEDEDFVAGADLDGGLPGFPEEWGFRAFAEEAFELDKYWGLAYMQSEEGEYVWVLASGKGAYSSTYIWVRMEKRG